MITEVKDENGDGRVDLADVEWLIKNRKNVQKRHSPVRMGDGPLCPLCGSRMVLRRRRSDGNPFYGCSTYPKC